MKQGVISKICKKTYFYWSVKENNYYKFVILINYSFCLQGAPGERGPAGPSGPAGPVVSHFVHEIHKVLIIISEDYS